MKAPAFWADTRPGLAARLLAPLGALYGAVTARHMAQVGERLAVPLICVGNFVVGGGGKTPAAMAIARMLLDMGERVAFISRGYGGAAGARAISVNPDVHGATEVGDEPLLLARLAPCFVARDRRVAAAAAIRAGASVLVLDDGLQNPALAKDLTFAMIDSGAGLGNGLCLPAGPLRAPLAAQLRHVAAIVWVGEGDPPAFGDKAVLTARLIPDPDVATRLAGRDVLAFAGIARPEKFYATLREIGARVVACESFADHHAFSAGDFARLLAAADAQKLVLTTTEKDAARLSPGQRRTVTLLPVTLIFDDAPRIAAMLREALATRRGASR
jgi:tetraacyldisaccharide 4'-kinase